MSVDFQHGLVVGRVSVLNVSASGATVGAVLTAPSIQGATYQWDLNGSPIGGATSATYTTTGAGAYSVTITFTTASVTISSGGGGGSPSLDFSQPTNSQYVPLLAA